MIDLNDIYDDENNLSSGLECNYHDVNSLVSSINIQDHKYKALHINIRSLASKFDKLKFVLDEFQEKQCDLDFVLICETFLNDTNHKLFEIDGYKMVDRHRTSSIRGGVAIYINNKYDFKIRNDLSIFEENVFESIFVELNTGSKNLVIGEVYRIPNTNEQSFLDQYESIVSQVNAEKKELLIGSDQNLNLLQAASNKNIQNFLDINYTNGLVPVILKPTRITYDTATLIDNFYTSNKDSHKSAILTTDISDHLPIFICFDKLYKGKLPKQALKFNMRDLSETNINKVIDDLSQIDWEHNMAELNTDESFEYLSSHITKALDKSCPMKLVKISQKNIIREPWMTPGLLKASRKLDKLHVLSIHSQQGSDKKIKYINYRNAFSKIKRKAKFTYYYSALHESKDNSAKQWKILNKIIGKVNNKKDLTSTFSVNGTLTDDLNRISNGFCRYFTNVGPEFAEKIPQSQKSYMDYMNGSYPASLFMTPTDLNEISKILNDMKPKKSSGHDGLSGWILKQLKDCITLPIVIAINKSIQSGEVPKSLKLAKVIPIYKAKDKALFTNYRPISLLPVLSKVLEKVIYKRTYSFLESQNILFNSQYGFRNGHSTIQAATELITDVLNGFEAKEYSIGVFLDLSKAFDTIDHSMLLKKLEFYGIRGLALSWFGNYLKDRQQYVDFKGCNSEQLKLRCGVPQGSVLGPLLFIIYTNDLKDVLNPSKPILFADDTTISYKHSDIYTLINIVNVDLEKACDWFRANKLSVNASKTHFMIFHSRFLKLPEGNFTLKMDGVILERTDNVKFLGLYIDDKLEWHYHISHIKSKLSQALYILNATKRYLPLTALKTLYYSLIYSHLNYGIVHWCNTYDYNLVKLRTLQNDALRAITKSKPKTTPHALYKKTNILYFSDVSKMETLKLVYGFVNKSLPQPLMTIFKFNESIHNYNTRQSNDPHHDPYKYNIVFESFLHKGPELWSTIPPDVKNFKSKKGFAKKVKKIFLSEY